jgi:gamma-glutamyltranspeptidase/glutathione hydrolase
VLCALATLLATAVGPARASPARVAAEHPLAVDAAIEILEAGGNAVDAAIAAMAATGVVRGASCGIGGGGFMLIYHAETGRALALDYREVAPGAASPARYLARGLDRITTGPLSVGVPGEPAGIVAAHERFGSLPLATVLAPAIGYARHGIRVDQHLAERIASQIELLAGDPGLARTFLSDDGRPLREHAEIRQPDLAATLERLGREGAEPFYKGAIAEAIIDTLDARKGLMTMADLTAYRVVWRSVLHGRYRGLEILSMPPPGSGGVLLAALNVLSGYDLAALGHGSAASLHVLAETLKAVFADRAHYYGDPAYVDIPIERLTSETHAAAIRARISPTEAVQPHAGGAIDGGTAHISVIDAAGNAVAATTTINTAFGSGIVAQGTGIILNNQLADFSLKAGESNVFGLVATEANVIAPRKRPLSSMIPTIALRGRAVEIVIGGSGGPTIITGVLQTLLAIIDFRLPAPQATAAPRIHHQGVPAVLAVEPSIPAATRMALQAKGHTVQEMPAIGAVSVVHVGPAGVDGAGAPRKGGASRSPGRAPPRPTTMRAE